MRSHMRASALSCLDTPIIIDLLESARAAAAQRWSDEHYACSILELEIELLTRGVRLGGVSNPRVHLDAVVPAARTRFLRTQMREAAEAKASHEFVELLEFAVLTIPSEAWELAYAFDDDFETLLHTLCSILYAACRAHGTHEQALTVIDALTSDLVSRRQNVLALEIALARRFEITPPAVAIVHAQVEWPEATTHE